MSIAGDLITKKLDVETTIRDQVARYFSHCPYTDVKGNPSTGTLYIFKDKSMAIVDGYEVIKEVCPSNQMNDS